MFNGRLAADHLLDRIKLVSLRFLFYFPAFFDERSLCNYVKKKTEAQFDMHR
jgi:hypothetical protein